MATKFPGSKSFKLMTFTFGVKCLMQILGKNATPSPDSTINIWDSKLLALMKFLMLRPAVIVNCLKTSSEQGPESSLKVINSNFALE